MLHVETSYSERKKTSCTRSCQADKSWRGRKHNHQSFNIISSQKQILNCRFLQVYQPGHRPCGSWHDPICWNLPETRWRIELDYLSPTALDFEGLSPHTQKAVGPCFSVIGLAEIFIWRTVQCDDAAQNEMRQGCSLAGHRTSHPITECMPLMEHSSCFKEPCRVKSTKLETLRLP